MRKIMYLLLALLLLTGCRSKKSNRTELKEEQKSERKEVKDSATHIEKSQKVSTFDFQQSQSYEISLESDRDSVGNAKDLYFTRMRDGTNEALVIRGGKPLPKRILLRKKALLQASNKPLLYRSSDKPQNHKNKLAPYLGGL